ncbi:hypothetical protein Q8A67_021713 [Cirrhinus molitorella]|uniref:Uncharacterized protein n=1 Tax=Cirrhinus molitorella TaxID=172907 RepID=A0AA88P410_9TELE|nr:hypothetical protein Q8A67_021713 [Cirrhinus molitorella]
MRACEEQAADRGSQPSATSVLTPAQPPRASLSLHIEVSPVLFSQPDQRPSVDVSDLVSSGRSEDEALDDSMSLAASDTEKLSGFSHDPAPLPSMEPSAAGSGLDAKLFRFLSKAVEELGLEWSLPEEPSRSGLDEWFLQAPCQRSVLVIMQHHCVQLEEVQPTPVFAYNLPQDCINIQRHVVNVTLKVGFSAHRV